MIQFQADDGQLTRRTAHELVRDTLRRAILTGTLPGGTRLVQAEIAGQLRVSTTPVREALRDLATEGLIQLDPHRGAIVRQVDRTEVLEIYQLRQLLEPEAMRRAAGSVSAEVLDRADRLRARLDSERDPGAWATLNRRFHAVLLAGVASKRLRTILGQLQDSAAPFVGLSLDLGSESLAAANAQHAALVDSLRSGDRERAAAITVAHLLATLNRLEVPAGSLGADHGHGPSRPAATQR